jgi:hypothetical protein
VYFISNNLIFSLNKSTAQKTRFSSFEDLFQNLAEPQLLPTARTNNIHIRHEPVVQNYLEEGAVALEVESDDEDVMIANPESIPNPALDQKIKQENDAKEEKDIIEGVFDQLYHAHIKTEEEPDPHPSHYFDEEIEQPEEVHNNEEPDSDDILNENIPVESQENNATKDIPSVNSQSNMDFFNDLISHQTKAQSPKSILRSTPNNSNNNSMLVEEKPRSQLLDTIVDEPLIDLNGGDDSDNKPANESQELYITGMNIKRPIIKDLFNDDNDFQSPIKKPTNKKQDNKKSKNNPPVNENKKTDSNHTEKNSKNNKKANNNIEVKQKSTEVKEANKASEKKTAGNSKKNEKSIVSQEKNDAEKQAQNSGSDEKSGQTSISRSKRRVVLQNMNKKYTDELKVVDGYFPNKQYTNTNTKQRSLPKKKSTTENKIIQVLNSISYCTSIILITYFYGFSDGLYIAGDEKDLCIIFNSAYRS